MRIVIKFFLALAIASFGYYAFSFAPAADAHRTNADAAEREIQQTVKDYIAAADQYGSENVPPEIRDRLNRKLMSGIASEQRVNDDLRWTPTK